MKRQIDMTDEEWEAAMEQRKRDAERRMEDHDAAWDDMED